MIVTVTINGKQGEGKSRLARQICGFLRAQSLSVMVVDGRAGPEDFHTPNNCGVAIILTKELP